MEISEDVLKIDKKLKTTKTGSCDQFLTKIKIFDLDNTGDGRIRIFFDRFAYIERRKRSPDAKIRPVLRIGSELDGKTGTMCVKLVTTAKIRWKQWGKTYELDSNTT